MKQLSLGLAAVALAVAVVAALRHAGGDSLLSLLKYASSSAGLLGVSSALWPWGHARQVSHLPQEPAHKVGQAYTPPKPHKTA